MSQPFFLVSGQIPIIQQRQYYEQFASFAKILLQVGLLDELMKIGNICTIFNREGGFKRAWLLEKPQDSFYYYIISLRLLILFLNQLVNNPY
ncbi:hypothetical protein FGO68_gene13752 [Halteria grandinella]|uniref:Uncharacterized protein n=1 Tax=Halteria grandinella TaxID=5974 RepID=A0A8J8NYT9_HALGN|nr:hypothetical protein FGO68_gene13752 [Halteria grandinella]